MSKRFNWDELRRVRGRVSGGAMRTGGRQWNEVDPKMTRSRSDAAGDSRSTLQ